SGALNAYKSGRNWQVHRRDLEAYRLRTQVERSVARAVFQDTALPEEPPAILTDREWYVLVEHVRHERSLGDIAAELGVTRTAVWQALDAAVRKYNDNPW